MNYKSIISNIFYSIIACLFIISIAITIYLGTFGWLITGWDPFEWTHDENFLIVFLGPFIYYISCLITFFTIDILVSKTMSNNLSFIISSNIYGSFFGIMGYFMIPIGIGVFTTYKSDSGEKIIVIPILALYLGFILIFGLFGFFLVWCNPNPKNATELKEWQEYITNTKIPVLKFVYVWFIIYFMGMTIFSSFIAIINKIISNPITSYYFDNGAFHDIQGALIFFPGPLFHTIAFIIYYWHPIRIKLNLYLLKHRSGIPEDKISTNKNNRDFKSNNNDKKACSNDLLQELDQKIAGKSPWIRFPILILLVQLFVIFSFEGIQASQSWQSFIIIYSFWIWLFYLNMFITSYLGKRFGLVKS